MNETVLLALGGNQSSEWGIALETQQAAISRLCSDSIHTLKASRFFSTPCFPAGAGPDFVNSALAVRTSLSPDELLLRLHEVEAEFGRKRITRWGTRTLDIDLIAYGQQVLPDLAGYTAWRDLPLDQQMQHSPDQLILPHPRLQDRAFVLVPLLDVAPDWMHPTIGRTIAEMLENLPESDRNAVIPL